MTAENNRVSAEQNRVNAEDERVQAETDRAAEFANWEGTIASKVPNTRTVNGKALSTDITLDAGDIGYDPTETYQAGSVGAELQEQNRQLSDLETRLKSGDEEDADLHLGFYLDENGDLCQVEEDENNG